MNVYLLGSTGFIGRHLKAALQAVGYTVWAHSREQTPLEQLKWSAICHADLVINAAGNTENESTMQADNTDLAIEVARCCAAFGKRLIHIGSMMELWPVTGYALSKLAATQNILGYDADFTVIRPATVYGPDDRPTSMLPTLWRAHSEDQPFVCRDDTRSWVHVDDLAAIITLLISERTIRGPIINVGGTPVSNADIVRWFEAAVGDSGKVTHQPGKVYPFEPTPFPSLNLRSMEEGVREYVDSRLFVGAWRGAEL